MMRQNIHAYPACTLEYAAIQYFICQHSEERVFMKILGMIFCCNASKKKNCYEEGEAIVLVL